MQGNAQVADVRGDSIRIERTAKTLRELTLDKMREAILGFYFRPGDRLVERDLCAQLGVSRTIVREVLRHLESEGLVANLPNRGPVVAETSPEEAWQIYEIRGVLEAMAARACASDPQPGVVAALDGRLDAIRSAYERGAMPDVLAATTDFYRILFEASGRLIALETVNSLTARINFLRSLTIKTEGRGSDGPREMEAIVEAIRQGQPDAAAKAAKAHVDNASGIARKLLEGRRER